MQKNKSIIWTIFFTTLAVSIISFFLPTPNGWDTSAGNFHQQLIVNVIMAFFHTGGAILFMANLDVYTSRLRQAYAILAAGTIIAGLGTLQITLLILFNIWETAYARSGITMLPFLLSGILFYLGGSAFAKVIGTKHALARTWIVFPMSLALTIGAVFLPYIPGPLPEQTYRILAAVDVWSGSLILFTALLVHIIKRGAGSHYSAAMAWLSRALFVSSFVLFYQGFYGYINVGNVLYLDIISNIITILSGLAWVRAGYAFSLTKYYSEYIPLRRFLFMRVNQKPSNQSKTIIDMVRSTANLASNSADIDPLLAEARTIASKLQSGESPSETDTQSLIVAYLKIEQYLLTREPIRVYTKQELRSRLDPALQRMIITEETRRNW